MTTKSTDKLLDASLVKNDWPLVETSGIKLFHSPLLSQEKSLTHAFTTRLGGQSEKPLDTFNLGKHWQTESARADALQNRKTLCEIFGLPYKELVVPGQVHSTNIHWAADRIATESAGPAETDGVATVLPDLPILLQFADCVPIILYDRKTHAVAVLHAGWRGTAAGISRVGASMLADVLNSKTENIIAAIGPSIGACCYPTGGDVAEKLKASAAGDLSRHISENAAPHPDLKAINALQLLQAGIAEVDVCRRCTACEPDLFFSHRKFEGKTGRQGALAALRKRALK